MNSIKSLQTDRSEAAAPSGSGLAVADASPFRPDGADAWAGTDRARVLLQGARGVSFFYSAGPSADGRWEWTDSWDYRETGRFPGAVRLEFSTASQGGAVKTSLVIPVFAGGGS